MGKAISPTCLLRELNKIMPITCLVHHRHLINTAIPKTGGIEEKTKILDKSKIK
jgi:hypothetical protein